MCGGRHEGGCIFDGVAKQYMYKDSINKPYKQRNDIRENVNKETNRHDPVLTDIAFLFASRLILLVEGGAGVPSAKETRDHCITHYTFSVHVVTTHTNSYTMQCVGVSMGTRPSNTCHYHL